MSEVEIVKQKVKDMLIGFGIEPFILVAYRGRQKVEIQHERDELDSAIMLSAMSEWDVSGEPVVEDKEDWEEA